MIMYGIHNANNITEGLKKQNKTKTLACLCSMILTIANAFVLIMKLQRLILNLTSPSHGEAQPRSLGKPTLPVRKALLSRC